MFVVSRGSDVGSIVVPDPAVSEYSVPFPLLAQLTSQSAIPPIIIIRFINSFFEGNVVLFLFRISSFLPKAGRPVFIIGDTYFGC